MEPKSINFAAIPQTAVNVVTKPAEFFQSMPKTGGFLEPLVFAVVMGFIAGIIQAILSFVGLGPGAAPSGAGMSGLGMILFMPIAAAMGSFVGGAILFVIWKGMGSQENYETAYRCGAYLMALSPVTAVMNAIPYAGVVLSMALYTFYLVTASVHVHKLPSQKAWLVFGIIGAVLAILMVYGEHKSRAGDAEANKWRQMGDDMRKEYQQSAEDMKKSSDEMRQQVEEMAEKFKEQAEEARRKAEQNQ